MRERTRNDAAIVIAAVGVILAIAALLAHQITFTGITLSRVGDPAVLVVADVDPASRYFGIIEPGTVVEEVNYASWMIVPEAWFDRYLRGDFVELGVLEPSRPFETCSGCTGTVLKSGYQYASYTFPPSVDTPVGFVFLVGLGLLFGTFAWVRRGQAGEALRPLAIPLAVATAMPLIVVPTSVSPSWVVAIGALVLTTAALLVLANYWVECIERPIRRRLAAAIAVAAAAGYMALQLFVLEARLPRITAIGELNDPLAVVLQQVPSQVRTVAAWALPPTLAAAITVVPAVALVTSSRRADVSAGASWGAPFDRLPVLLAALTPIVIAITFGYGQLGFGLSLPLIWLLVVVFVLQTNARAETMRTQRDTVVAATEAERARLAADLHDDALQEMTVLVRRLDDAGDTQAAELARSIAERLREVCGDLRLPVLDELGAGAALEWLVGRVDETSGSQVQLERDDRVRPPAEVELAVFRVAQEALANAVIHGAPPIVVRYAAASDRASLSITDHGAGISPDAAANAARSGHYGLLNMRQRAEQVGARIEVRRPADGGTSVGFNWSSA
jgi:signal transduction histidine kinase